MLLLLENIRHELFITFQRGILQKSLQIMKEICEDIRHAIRLLWSLVSTSAKQSIIILATIFKEKVSSTLSPGSYLLSEKGKEIRPWGLGCQLFRGRLPVLFHWECKAKIVIVIDFFFLIFFFFAATHFSGLFKKINCEFQYFVATCF